MKEVQKASGIEITVKCIPSKNVTSTKYRITLEIEPTTRLYRDGHCSYQAGNGTLCKHGAALSYFLTIERSDGCTDKPQQWKAPSQSTLERYRKGEEISKLFPNSRPLPSLSNSQDNSIKTALKNCNLMNSSLFKSISADDINLESDESDLSDYLPFLDPLI